MQVPSGRRGYFVQTGFVGVSFKKRAWASVPQYLLEENKHFQGRLVRSFSSFFSWQLAGKFCLGAPSRGNPAHMRHVVLPL